MSNLVHVSLFSGIGGIDLAMHTAGVPTVLACEADKAARGVLAHRFPETELHPDVRTLTGDTLRRLADPRRTVLSAGFPCQDLSVAGARRGMVEGSGTRSALYWEVDRLLGDFRPAWVILENVPGLLSSRGGRDMGTVLGSLAQRGYGFAYRVLDARYFGVPQRRRRVVIVGRLGDDGRAPAQVLLEPEGVRGDSAEGITPRQVFARGARAGVADGGRQTAVTLMARGNPSYDPELENYAIGVLGDQAHTLTAEGYDASEDGTGRGTPVVVAPQHAATLTAGISRPGVSAPGRRQEDDHNIVAFHMTQDPISGSVSPPMGAGASGMGIAYAADAIGTLTASAQGGWRIGADEAAAGQLVVEVDGHLDHPGDLIVRRLTPLECERLQGVPDNHTATSAGKPQADAPRYKQMGNGVAVPVFAWVSRRLVAVDDHLRSAAA